MAVQKKTLSNRTVAALEVDRDTKRNHQSVRDITAKVICSQNPKSSNVVSGQWFWVRSSRFG